MPRPKKNIESSTPEGYGSQPHAANIIITNFDWFRLQEAAEIEKLQEGTPATASSIMRQLIINGLDNHPQAQHLREAAELAIAAELSKEQLRAKLQKPAQ